MNSRIQKHETCPKSKLGRRAFIAKTVTAGVTLLGLKMLGVGRLVFRTAEREKTNYRFAVQPTLLRDEKLSVGPNEFQKWLTQNSDSQASYQATRKNYRGMVEDYYAPEVDGLIWVPEKSQFAGLSVFGGLPFSATRENPSRWLNSTAGQEALSRYFSNLDCEPIFLGCYGQSYGRVGVGTSSPLSPESKIATTARSTSPYLKAGCETVQVTSISNMKDCLRAGDIDLTAMIPHEKNIAHVMHRYGERYFVNESDRHFNLVLLLFKKTKWSALSDEERAGIKAAASKTAQILEAKFEDSERAALSKIALEMPVIRYEYPAEIKASLLEKTQAVLEDIYKRNPLAKELCTAYLRHQSRSALT